MNLFTTLLQWQPPTDGLPARLTINWLLILSLALGIAVLQWALPYFMRNTNWTISKASFSLPGGAQVEIAKNEATRYIANRIYVDLVSRKVTLPFDHEHDVLHNVYASQYKAFTDIREELKTIPGQYLSGHKGTGELIKLTLDILNTGMRPHLTQYGTHFKEWYEQACAENRYPNKTALEIQRYYPQYGELVQHLHRTQLLLQEFADQLYTRVIQD